jgi:hypothetical protein
MQRFNLGAVLLEQLYVHNYTSYADTFYPLLTDETKDHIHGRYAHVEPNLIYYNPDKKLDDQGGNIV